MKTIWIQFKSGLGGRKRNLGLVLFLAGLSQLTFPPQVSAVILMEVLEPLSLFEIEGAGFTFYATSERTTLRIRDTDTGDSGIVTVGGQDEERSTLTLCASSEDDSSQMVLIRINVAQLRRAGTRRFVTLKARGVAKDPRHVTDPALAALVGRLEFGFRLERETVNPETGNRVTIYSLVSVGRRSSRNH